MPPFPCPQNVCIGQTPPGPPSDLDVFYGHPFTFTTFLLSQQPTGIGVQHVDKRGAEAGVKYFGVGI